MIDCHKCKNYYVTWDKHFPHGCKAMGFKSKQLPSVKVFVSSNRECLLYKVKDLTRCQNQDQSLHDIDSDNS
jgi:hypothetical protein